MTTVEKNIIVVITLYKQTPVTAASGKELTVKIPSFTEKEDLNQNTFE